MHAQTVPRLLADVVTGLAAGSTAQVASLLGVVLQVSVLLKTISRVLGTHQVTWQHEKYLKPEFQSARCAPSFLVMVVFQL